ncbi:plasmid partitioning protein RepB [Thioclava indica]|nr:plasmid partitioning protein RepB [Thioclava indica]
MARRNLFQPPAPPSTGSTESPTETKSRFPNTGAMSGVKSTLKDLSSNAVREIAPHLIDDGGPKDRLFFADEDVATLAQSIKEFGQQVPIMVRPIVESPGRYRIVYGRRRLRALALLGQSAKALVRSLSDEDAVLAQGQENSQRLDPSFIEKALFANELTDAGYESSVILDALAIDKPMLSRMNKVTRGIPRPVVGFIGPAHGVGRRRWEELSELFNSGNQDVAAMLSAIESKAGALPSDERFDAVHGAMTRSTASPKASRSAPPALSMVHEDGTVLAEVKETTRALTFKLSKTDTPDFARWMRDNAEAELKRLYEAWQASAKAD